MLAGAACAALLSFAMPAAAADYPSTTGYGSQAVAPNAVANAVNAYYSARPGTLLWAGNSAGGQLIQILRRAPLDGLASGPDLAARAQSLLARASAGDTAARGEADRLLSTAWILYVQALRTPPAGMNFADSWAAPRQATPIQILGTAAASRNLSQHIAEVSQVNPLYARLRDAAWANMQSGQAPDSRVLASLDRAREAPFQDRYLMVDAASATLYMIDHGRIAGSMKVVVGKPGDATETPMVASTIYYATLNPYWHVTDELVRDLTAPNVLKDGLSYLTSHGYQVFDGYGDDAQRLDPAKVDWKAVAAGTEKVAVRQLPGPANSMGEMKFGFANKYDIYLHDTPRKEVFAEADRDLSHGCIRLSDAPRLARFLLGRDPRSADNGVPEQHVELPTPVPIYVTYLTAQVRDGQLAFVDDIYGRDSMGGGTVVAAR
jgi:murein L,D-transpeptidase YcbB/YkuD